MTKEDFNDLADRVKRGDNSALSYLHPLQEKCIRSLMIQSESRCDRDQAYDIFIESVLDFRKNILRDTVEYQNIQGYLRRMSWNKWLAMSRARDKQQSKRADVTTVFYDNPDPESQLAMEEIYEERLSAIQQAMESLSGQCRKILHLSIAEELSMSEIAGLLNMASADVAKTTKSRCYRKLLDIIRNNGDS